MIVVRLPQEPRGKGRTRFSSRNNSHRTPEKTRAYESALAQQSMAAMSGKDMLEGPLNAIVLAVFEPAKSWSKKRKASALAGDIRPTKTPDVDNIAKSALDAMNGIVYKDDAQVTNLTVRKFYGPEAYVEIEVSAA